VDRRGKEELLHKAAQQCNKRKANPIKRKPTFTLPLAAVNSPSTSRQAHDGTFESVCNHATSTPIAKASFASFSRDASIGHPTGIQTLQGSVHQEERAQEEVIHEETVNVNAEGVAVLGLSLGELIDKNKDPQESGQNSEVDVGDLINSDGSDNSSEEEAPCNPPVKKRGRRLQGAEKLPDAINAILDNGNKDTILLMDLMRSLHADLYRSLSGYFSR